MTNDQKVLEALLNAGGQEVLMVRLAEISPRSLPFMGVAKQGTLSVEEGPAGFQ